MSTPHTNPMAVQLQRLRAAHLAGDLPPAGERIDRLRRLEALLTDHQAQLCAVMADDFGGRPQTQSRMEILGTLESVRHAIRHVATWMKPEKRSVPWLMRLLGARAEVMFQPLGVVGVVAPWNFPLVLSIGALAGVFAAGNRAMLKPSELTPLTSDLLKQLLDERFSGDELATVLGDAAVGAEFTRLPFDHLLFTGAPSVARHVMRAAAENLVPVTLELGGKCPVVIGAEADLDMAAERVMWGKIQNAGQICLAPDHVYVPRARLEDFIDRARRQVQAWYPGIRNGQDFCAIINARHYERLNGYLEEARQRGVRVEALAAGDIATRRIAPTLVIEPPDDLAIMQDEIFGPLLPVIGYDDPESVITRINAQPRSLALYYFGNARGGIEQLATRTTSGGMTVNDIATHAAIESLPLGGVGNSGMGRYHGRDGFLAFSHPKAVFRQGCVNLARLFNPPYTAKQEKMLDRAIGKRV